MNPAVLRRLTEASDFYAGEFARTVGVSRRVKCTQHAYRNWEIWPRFRGAGDYPDPYTWLATRPYE